MWCEGVLCAYFSVKHNSMIQRHWIEQGSGRWSVLTGFMQL